MLIQPEVYGMHQDGPQQAIAQLPQITCPDLFYLAVIVQMTKDGVDEIANLFQEEILVGCCFGRMRFAKRSLQKISFAAQAFLQIWKPIIAIFQHHDGRSFQQQRDKFSTLLIGRLQNHTGEQTRPTWLSLQTKPMKRMSIGKIFAIVRLATEMDTPARLGKTTHRNWRTIHNGQAGMVAAQLVAQSIPQVPFDRLPIGCLSHESRAIFADKPRKKLSVVMLEGAKEVFILGEPQVSSDYFYGDDFTLRQFWDWASCSQPLVFDIISTISLIQQKHAINKIVQFSGNYPQMFI